MFCASIISLLISNPINSVGGDQYVVKYHRAPFIFCFYWRRNLFNPLWKCKLCFIMCYDTIRY